MMCTTRSFESGAPIPTRYAMGRSDPTRHAGPSDNLNPGVEFHELPAETRSLAVTLHDLDAPTTPVQVNREGVTVPFDLPRTEFSHWVLVDLDPAGGPIAEGEFSREVTVGGKTGPVGPRGTRQGLNDFTSWFRGDSRMEGRYFGYDGPWPPWNDERVHRYQLTVYALDIARCPVEGDFTLADVRRAIEGHVLGAAHLRGTYAIWAGARMP